ncbi:MAG: glucose 1-dehydrogenase [Candidatus Handelsmanbacteria bacterium]|nr:glucose 1-dehydrogenase [Candidatus Handelsmanbacteria bacterium]
MGHLSRFELKDKVIIVTGAGRGIGRTIALDCVRSGARVAVGSRTTGELETLAAEIKHMGGECFYHRLDVVLVSSINEFFAEVVSHYGRIDGLVNNAGYNKQAPILDYNEELYNQIIDANLKSVFFCSQVAAKQFIAQGKGGAIVNIASQAGVIGAPGRGPYSGAKGGVINLTRTMAVEWAKHQIRINGVAPTVTRSPMAEAAMRDNKAFAEAVKTMNLLRGGLAEPEEMSAPTVFLLSEAASMITGHTLVVDGGWTIA